MYHLQIDNQKYLLQVQKVLIHKGEIITVDYCLDPENFRQFHQFKVINYQNHNVVHDNIFEGPGLQDISICVNMTNLAETAGYQKLFYGKQEQLPINSFPEVVIPQASKDFFIKTSEASSFVVLVQEKAGKDEKTSQLESDSKRFKGQALPVSRLEIRQRLENIFAILTDYPHQQLIQEASAHCKDRYASCLDEIKKKNYGAALRKACAAGSIPLVKVLLKHKNWLSQDFDINEPSSNGKTAYNWVMTATFKSDVKVKLIQMLVSAGAKTAAPTSIASSPAS